MRPTLALAIVCATVAIAKRAPAAAPELGDRGHFVLSAERLFGYVHSTTGTTTAGGLETSRSTDSFTLLTSPAGVSTTGYGWPRIALDAFVARNISLGGSLGIVHLSPDGGDSITGFIVAPRIGYAGRLTSHLAIWPRLGFTYVQLSTNPAGGGPDITLKSYALTAEVPVALFVTPGVALTIGPTFDLGIGGSRSLGGASVDSQVNDFGIQAGLLVVL
jgi:hypothetical protein